MTDKTEKRAMFKRHEYAISFDESLLGKSNLEIIRFLKDKTNLFQELPSRVIDKLVPLSEIEQFKQGEKLLVEDTPNDKIYFLMRGTIGIYKQEDFILKLRRKGDIFGEMSLISDKPCSASVVAETDVQTFSIKVRNIGNEIDLEEKIIKDSLYCLYAVILADKLALTTYKAVGLEQKVQERTIELIKVNKQIQEEKVKAEQANEAKTNFLSNITHELRTPMHHIYSFAQIGIQFFNGKKQKSLECFHKILNSCHSMMGLIDNLLDFSNLERGIYERNFTENDMLAMIDENIAGLEQSIDEKEIVIKSSRSDEETKIICDRRGISQVIKNLLSNAIKFSQKGKSVNIIIKSTSLPSSESETTVPAILVAIKDEGPGIPEEELDQVFDKFTQSSRTKNGAGGAGLGLAVCYEIVKSHLGIIYVENNEENGCTFTFVIPYSQEIQDDGQV
ncbi:MAG: ATP-binding protein [Proteobacteria bacterium]|nr:ATP-binding protein [Pseudomonadota bacterium]